jgi:hypothetical protein
MKVLTRRQQKKLLRLIAANQIIMHMSKVSPDNLDQFILNDCEMVNLIAGLDGIKSVRNMVYGKVD